MGRRLVYDTTNHIAEIVNIPCNFTHPVVIRTERRKSGVISCFERRNAGVLRCKGVAVQGCCGARVLLRKGHYSLNDVHHLAKLRFTIPVSPSLTFSAINMALSSAS